MHTHTQQLTRRRFLSTTARTVALGTLALVAGCTYGIIAQTSSVVARKIVPQNDSPPVRANHSMIYDSKLDRLGFFAQGAHVGEPYSSRRERTRAAPDPDGCL